MKFTRVDWTVCLAGWLMAALFVVVGVAQPQLQAIDLPPGEQVGPRPPEQPKLRETDWSKRIAADFRAQGIPAETEFVCPDGSRVDVLTPDYAIEVDYGHGGKWKEAIGQAVFYGVVTNRKPMVILLMSKEYDRIDYLRCAVACAKIGVDIRVHKID